MIRHRSHIQRFSAGLTAMMVVGSLLSASYGPRAVPSPIHDHTAVYLKHSGPEYSSCLWTTPEAWTNLRLAALPPFNPNTDYSGIFDARQCYQYQAGGAERFRTTGAFPKSLANDCPNPSHPWDGSLLNYVSMTRMDIAKVVMTGGRCEGARDAAGACPGGNLILTESNGDTISIPAADAANRFDPPPGLIPGADVWFHTPGFLFPPFNGFLCVDNVPGFFSGTCAAPALSRVRVEFSTEPTGVIQEIGDRARFALMVYNTNEGGRIIVDMGDNLALLTQIDNTVGVNWTPLAETIYEATRYFAQLPPVYNQLGPDYIVSQAKDPFYFQPPWVSTPQYVTCCKNFIILFTDGQPTQDQNIPVGLQEFAHAAAAHTLDHHDTCSAYFGGPTSDPCNGLGSHFLDDVAYWAHTTDLRQANVPIGAGPTESGKDLPGMQNVTLYTFFAFGTGSTLLSDAAKVGGFVDRNDNGIPDLPQEYDRINNVTGVTGSDGIPDNYFEASDAAVMADRLRAAIYSILGQSTSSTAVSVSSSSASGEGATYQAYFFPSVFEGLNEIRWLGFTQSLFVDVYGHLREDTDGDGRLVYAQDKIVVTRFETATNTVKVDRYSDANEDGLADSVMPDDTIDFTEIKPIWEAGRRLALTDPDTRRILTWVDTNNNGKVDIGEVIPFSSANVRTLAPYVRAGAAPYTAANTIDFIRGKQAPTLRDRMKTVKNDSGVNVSRVWKLGDIVNSSPVVVGRPSERYDVLYGDDSYSAFIKRYKDRRQVVYVGANDGMLHAFNAGFYTDGDDPATLLAVEHGRFDEIAPASVVAKYAVRPGTPKRGEELWGYIPYELLPQLQWLMQPDYAHVDYVDLPSKVTDARIFTPDADHPNGWGTILIGGMRFGGSCDACNPGTGGRPMTFTADFGPGHIGETRTFYSAYFVLDITNPERDPVLLWSFTDSNLGLTTSHPAVVRVSPTTDIKNDNSNAQWFMVVGSGVTTYTGKSAQKGRIFVVDLATGPKDALGNNLYSTFSTGDLKASMGDVVTVDLDLDYRVDVIYVGNTIRTAGGSPEFTGKLYRLTTGGCTTAPCTTTTWGIDIGGARVPTVLLATFVPPATTPMGPVTGAPNASIDDTNAIWVYWGTGHFYGDADQSNTDTQYFFGVKDPVLTGGCAQATIIDCQQNDLVDVSSAVVCSICVAPVDQVTGSQAPRPSPRFKALSKAAMGGLRRSPHSGNVHSAVRRCWVARSYLQRLFRRPGISVTVKAREGSMDSSIRPAAPIKSPFWAPSPQERIRISADSWFLALDCRRR